MEYTWWNRRDEQWHIIIAPHNNIWKCNPFWMPQLIRVKILTGSKKRENKNCWWLCTFYSLPKAQTMARMYSFKAAKCCYNLSLLFCMRLMSNEIHMLCYILVTITRFNLFCCCCWLHRPPFKSLLCQNDREWKWDVFCCLIVCRQCLRELKWSTTQWHSVFFFLLFRFGAKYIE